MNKSYEAADANRKPQWTGSRDEFLEAVNKICYDEEEAEQYLFDLKYPNGFRCPKCGHTHYYRIVRERKAGKVHHACEPKHHVVFECAECGCQTSLTAGTVMHQSKLSLTVWFQTIRLFCSCKTGVSTKTVARFTGISYHAARLLTRKIKTAMEESNANAPLEETPDTVEIDMFTIGGVAKGGKRGRGAAKKVNVEMMVASKMVEVATPSGHLTQEKVLAVKTRQIRSETAEELDDFLSCWLDPNAATVIRGDESPANKKLGAMGWNMSLMNSTKVKKVNYLEQTDHFISNLNANIQGAHHGIGLQFLQMELAELEWSHRNREKKNIHKMNELVGDLLLCGARPRRYMADRFKQIQSNGNILPDTPLAVCERWSGSLNAAVPA